MNLVYVQLSVVNIGHLIFFEEKKVDSVEEIDCYLPFLYTF